MRASPLALALALALALSLAAPAARADVTHVFTRGETFAAIAERYYGTASPRARPGSASRRATSATGAAGRTSRASTAGPSTCRPASGR